MRQLIRWLVRIASVVGYLLMVRWLMKVGKPRDDLWQAEEWYLRMRARVRQVPALLRAAWMDLTGKTHARWEQLKRDSWRLEFGIE